MCLSPSDTVSDSDPMAVEEVTVDDNVVTEEVRQLVQTQLCTYSCFYIRSTHILPLKIIMIFCVVPVFTYYKIDHFQLHNDIILTLTI